MKAYFEKTAALFFVLGMLFIPLHFYGSDFQFRLARFVFLKPVAFIQGFIANDAYSNIGFSSDAFSFAVLLGLLLLAAAVIAFFRWNALKISVLSRIIAVYYLSFILLKYGFDKIFKAQFYLPEPNILYTPFGNLSKDILYWSTMGTSYPYSVIIGSIEVGIAFLLLIRKTRILGLLMAVGAFVNIVIINFSFDISVKLFSCFLLLLVFFILAPFLKTLYDFFISHKKVHLKQETYPLSFFPGWRNGIKTFVVGLMLLQVLYPYLASGNTDDDTSKKIFLHGAYAVKEIIIDNDTLKPSGFPIKKMFVHRNSYFIFQKEENQMVDYFMRNDMLKNHLELYDYQKRKLLVQYKYRAEDSLLELRFNDGRSWKIISKGINWKKLPVFKEKFHLMVDEVK